MDNALWIVVIAAIGVILYLILTRLLPEAPPYQRFMIEQGLIKPGKGTVLAVAELLARRHTYIAPDLRIDKNVQFTVYRPATIAPKKWYRLLAFAHLSKRRPGAPQDEPDPVKEVLRQAARILSDQPAVYERIKVDRGFSVPLRGLLTFVPSVEGCEFNPPSQSVRWLNAVQKAEFEMMASEEIDGREVEGQMTVYLGKTFLTEVPVRINVDSLVAQKSQQAPLEEASAEPYRKIFASYSHKDTQIVEDFEDYIQALGDQYLQDVRTLRSGEVWSEKLEEMIRQATIFQLFWSSNSMHSPFVRKEWEYALGLNRAKFIRPVYWEEPLPEIKPDLPPEALKRLHFYKFPAPKKLGYGAASVLVEAVKRSGAQISERDPRLLKADSRLELEDWEDVYLSSRSMGPWVARLVGVAILILSLIVGLIYIGYRLWGRPQPAPSPTPVASP